MSMRLAFGTTALLAFISHFFARGTQLETTGVRRGSSIRVGANGEAHGEKDSVRRQKVAQASKHDTRPMCGQITSKEPGRWVGNVSADGALGVRMTYDLDSCQLRRYTAETARQCLRGKHLVLVGDSLTRYQYLSLAHMLIKGEYPEPGIPASQSYDEPNVCQEGDYLHLQEDFLKENGLTRKDLGWPAFMVHTSQSFRAQERCDCWRVDGITNSTVENRFYRDPDLNLSVSYFTKMAPQVQIHGHYPVDHELPPAVLNKARFEQIGKTKLDWQSDGANFINTVLPKIEHDFGQVSAVLWNQGLWGRMGAMPDFVKQTRAFFNERKARAFWKSTTHQGVMNKDEMSLAERLRDGESYITEANGWEGLDATRILKEITLRHPGSEHGIEVWNKQYLNKGLSSTFGSGLLEFNAVHWDYVHYRPWVYEELNNIWLNMLCN